MLLINSLGMITTKPRGSLIIHNHWKSVLNESSVWHLFALMENLFSFLFAHLIQSQQASSRVLTLPLLSWLPSFECHCQSSAVLQSDNLSNSDHYRTNIRQHCRTDIRHHVCKDRVGSEHPNKDGRNLRETESGEFTKGKVTHLSLINLWQIMCRTEVVWVTGPGWRSSCACPSHASSSASQGWS